jgi:hypothetical protein
VNPDHARPLVAFGLLAAAAAVITGTGLHTNDSAAPPSAAQLHASTSATPELVLGGVLRARPDSVLSNPLAPQLWGADSVVTPTGGAVQVASPGSPTTTHKARTKSGGGQATTTGGGGHASQTTTEPVSSATSAHGKGHGKPDQPVKATATATATATPTPPGNGKGRPDTAGH